MRHHDEVIKLATISCISEIMKITTPNDPYDNYIVKEVLQIMAASFEGLDDIKNPYFSKRVKLLEIFAKFRFENNMIAMDCVDIICKMFHIFWRVIDEFHPSSVITSMQSITFSVLYEEDDAISKLMSNDLWVVWKGEQDASPMAHELLKRLVEQHKDRDTSPMICRNLHDDFVRHVDLTQEDMRTALGNELSASSLKEVSVETTTLDSQDIKVDVKIDLLPSGAATSVLTKPDGGDTLQWHDIITNLFEDNSIMFHNSHEIAILTH
ncbi:hypothetical protein SUGI_0385470 [Cryptomeria japonica]|nr:hypothetical protein SUGI_0385470 [Cryptomeria japonica]